MAQRGDDAIDFKPFFDMVVGVLFILLILVSAQLFFSQWQNAASPAEVAAREAEARRLRADADAAAFMEELTEALRAAGFSPAVDRLGRSVSIPANEVMKGEATDPEALSRFSPALLAVLRCVATPSRPASCRSGTAVRLARMDLRALLQGEAGGTPGSRQRLAGLEIAAGLFGAAPDLLGLTGPGGVPVTQGVARVEMIAGAPRLALDFAFDGGEARTSP
jgi:hypothetical protein